MNYEADGHYNAHTDSSPLLKTQPCCHRGLVKRCRICRLVCSNWFSVKLVSITVEPCLGDTSPMWKPRRLILFRGLCGFLICLEVESLFQVSRLARFPDLPHSLREHSKSSMIRRKGNLSQREVGGASIVDLFLYPCENVIPKIFLLLFNFYRFYWFLQIFNWMLGA